MRPTEILKSEHRVIELVVDCLEQLAFQCLAEGRLDAGEARMMIDFFQTFADQCHHAKEETYLFPRMEARGFSRAHGPTGVMLHEHDEGRRYLRELADVVDAAAAGDRGALREFARLAGYYVTLLRHHIRKEDQRLFPMADHCLTEQDQEALGEAFARVENCKLHAGTHEKYLQMATELAARYGVGHAVVEASRECCGCGHESR
jgi:hemerythrin-like domain-containing protein